MTVIQNQYFVAKYRSYLKRVLDEKTMNIMRDLGEMLSDFSVDVIASEESKNLQVIMYSKKENKKDDRPFQIIFQ